jgi:eukaryotic-like serine/threonine-protein kinase
MSHLDEKAVAEFIAGQRSSESASEILRHLDECTPCRELFAAAAKTSSGGIGTTLLGATRPSEHQGFIDLNTALPRGTVLGRYILIERLGEGGMGVVYSAYDPQLDRRVALKLLRPDVLGSDTAESQARLLREAQAMARLSHPNVIAVHDVGTVEGRAFIAMEYVEGGTLTQWLHSAVRSFAEVIEAFLAAGRALAAAHAAGVIHRDFKPDNALVGKDGRVRVTDFGLARGEISGAPLLPEGMVAERSPFAVRLTQTGTLLGSPAYMSLEQLQRQPADARSDQFSFCVALYEGLYGVRPFPGDTLQEIESSILHQNIRPVPRSTKVPARVERIVRRGLAPRREDRYPSMDALLDQLRRDPATVWRRRGLIGAGVLIAGAFAAIPALLQQRRRAACDRDARTIEKVWGPSRSQALGAVFAAQHRTFVDGMWSDTKAQLDRYAQEWSGAARETCETSSLDPAQRQRRMSCLEDQRDQLGALIDVLSEKPNVDWVMSAAAALPRPSGCADTTDEHAPPPIEPRRRSEVAAFRHDLYRLQQFLNDDKAKEALPVALAGATAAVERSEALGIVSLKAEASLLHGRLLERAGQKAEAKEAYRHALDAAEVEPGSKASLWPWLEMARFAACAEERHFDEARWLAGIAAARAARFTQDAWIQRHVEISLARIFACLQDVDQATLHLKNATALTGKIGDLDSLPEAIIAYETAKVALARGKYEEAATSFDVSRAIRQRIGFPEPNVPNQAGLALALQGRCAEALERHREARQLWEASLGAESAPVAAALNNEGAMLDCLGRDDEAKKVLERSRAIREKVFGPDSTVTARTLANLGRVKMHQGQLVEATRYLDRAIKLLQASHEPDNLSEAYVDAGELDMLHHDAHAASRHFRSAVELREQLIDPVLLAQARFGLAQALWEANHEDAQSVLLAESARAAYSAPGVNMPGEVSSIDEWIAQHGGTPRVKTKE